MNLVDAHRIDDPTGRRFERREGAEVVQKSWEAARTWNSINGR